MIKYGGLKQNSVVSWLRLREEAGGERRRARRGAYAQEEARRFRFNQRQAMGQPTPRRSTKDLQAMRRTALSQGFSEDEISQVYDSRECFKCS
jgi:hypothetical protein